jgi:hypothetical protein
MGFDQASSIRAALLASFATTVVDPLANTAAMLPYYRPTPPALLGNEHLDARLLGMLYC